MKNKKRKTGEELKEHKRKAKQNKVSSTHRLLCSDGTGSASRPVGERRRHYSETMADP